MTPLGEGLLQVEVQVAERAGRHEAVRVGVGGVAQVAAGLLQHASLFIVMMGKPQHFCAPAYSMTVPPSASMSKPEVVSRG